MTSTEINEAIAVLCGRVWYKWRNSILASTDYWGETRLAFPPEEGIGFKGSAGTVSETRICNEEEIAQAKTTGKFNGLSIPNYTTSLDACTEFEKVMEPNDQYSYGEHLRIITRCVGPKGGHYLPNGFGIYAIATATPLQRCETFLRLHNQWKE